MINIKRISSNNITTLNNSLIPSTIQQSVLPNQQIPTNQQNQQNSNKDISTQFFDKKKKKKTITSTDTNTDTENIVDIDILSKKKKKHFSSLNTNQTDKKKKKLTLLDKKKKKILQVTGIPWALLPDKLKKRLKFDGMKEKICGLQFGDFIDIDVDDRTVYWGMGIEHEMQLFHKAKSGMKNTSILFNSQESTCTLSGDTHKQGACCKMKTPCYTHNKDEIASFALTKEEKRYLFNMQWELTGRQAKGCLPEPTIIKRVPVLMPELITTNFTNRTIQSISQEIRELENNFIAIQMKNPYTREKVAKYGALTTHSCGSLDNILVPKTPTIHSPEYQFDIEPMTDYLGSYHVTITLPYTRDIKKTDYIKMHKEMANQIQWLEPLLTCAFFSGTAAAVGVSGEDKDTEGSFRVMNIGWGNFAGSNIRKMGTSGLDRGANIFPNWRRGFHFKQTKRLDQCAQKTEPYYKKAHSIHAGDFRTFGYEPDYKKCKELYRADECPKADGAPIKPPYGLEIRIFDHFKSEYLIQLLKLIVLIAANGARHPATQYIYHDKRWIEALREVMRDGWNSTLSATYVTALRTNLGLPIQTDSLLAMDILTAITDELHAINKESFIVRIMDETPMVKPILPEINRLCWELPFVKHYQRKFLNIMRHIFFPGETVTPAVFSNRMEEQMGSTEWDKWRNDVNDVLYTLETYKHVKLNVFNGQIIDVTVIF